MEIHPAARACHCRQTKQFSGFEPSQACVLSLYDNRSRDACVVAALRLCHINEIGAHCTCTLARNSARDGSGIVRVCLQYITRGLRRLVSPSSVGLLRSAVPFALAAAIAAQIVQIGIDLKHTRAALLEATRVPPPPTFFSARPSVSSMDIRSVLAAHLFGAAAENENDGPAASAPAPVQWVLSGVIERAVPEVGFAIIGETAGSTRLRLVGEEVAKGFKLVRVLSDRVIIGLSRPRSLERSDLLRTEPSRR